MGVSDAPCQLLLIANYCETHLALLIALPGPAVLRFSGSEPAGSFFFVASEHRDNVVYGDNEKLVVVFKVNRDRIFGVEQDLVVLS